MRKKIGTVLFILLNVLIIGYTAYSEFHNKKVNVLPEFSKPWYLLLAVLCLIIVVICETWKYVYMMQISDERKSIRTAFETAMLGKYYDFITPSGAGGQPFQMYWLKKCNVSDGGAFAMPIAGFITMQFGFIVPALILFVVYRDVELEAIRVTAYLGLIMFSLLPVTFILFSFKPEGTKRLISTAINIGAKLKVIKEPEVKASKAIKTLEDFSESIKIIAKTKNSIFVLMALSIVYRIALCSIPYFVLMAITSVSYIKILATTFYIYSAITIIPTPGNSGAAEGAFYLVFSGNGTFWAMIIWRLLTYYSFILLGGLIYAYRALERRKNDKNTV